MGLILSLYDTAFSFYEANRLEIEETLRLENEAKMEKKIAYFLYKRERILLWSAYYKWLELTKKEQEKENDRNLQIINTALQNWQRFIENRKSKKTEYSKFVFYKWRQCVYSNKLRGDDSYTIGKYNFTNVRSSHDYKPVDIDDLPIGKQIIGRPRLLGTFRENWYGTVYENQIIPYNNGNRGGSYAKKITIKVLFSQKPRSCENYEYNPWQIPYVYERTKWSSGRVLEPYTFHHEFLDFTCSNNTRIYFTNLYDENLNIICKIDNISFYDINEYSANSYTNAERKRIIAFLLCLQELLEKIGMTYIMHDRALMLNCLGY